MALPQPTPDNRAVVTGASSGIGEALAIELASRGYNLLLVARRTDLMDALAEDLAARFGIVAEVRGVDLADRHEREKLRKELVDRDIAILCNNAGIATFGPLSGLDPDYERAQVDLNAVAVHDLTLAVLPSMLERGSGGILITGSAAGNMPVPNNATYAATKAFVNSFSESLRGELKGSGVHVTLLAPGPIRTAAPPAEEASIVDRVIPDFLWTPSSHAAKVSIDALAENRMRVVPGLLSKAMSTVTQYSPRALIAPVVGAIYKKLGGS